MAESARDMKVREDGVAAWLISKLVDYQAYSDAQWDRYFEGYWRWLRFHLPRLGTNLAVRLALDAVKQAVETIDAGGELPEPPHIPKALEAIWGPFTEDGGTKLMDEVRSKYRHGVETGAYMRKKPKQPALKLTAAKAARSDAWAKGAARSDAWSGHCHWRQKVNMAKEDPRQGRLF